MNAPVTKPANLADSWHQHTLRGNTEFQLACYDDALRLHRCALDHAVEDFPVRVNFCVDHAIARVLISHFSMADCHRALADYERAAQNYIDAQRFLLRCERELDHAPRTRNAIAHGNLHLQQLWCEFVKAHDEAIPHDCRCAYRDGDMHLVREAGVGSVLH